MLLAAFFDEVLTHIFFSVYFYYIKHVCCCCYFFRAIINMSIKLEEPKTEKKAKNWKTSKSFLFNVFSFYFHLISSTDPSNTY